MMSSGSSGGTSRTIERRRSASCGGAGSGSQRRRTAGAETSAAIVRGRRGSNASARPGGARGWMQRGGHKARGSRRFGAAHGRRAPARPVGQPRGELAAEREGHGDELLVLIEERDLSVRVDGRDQAAVFHDVSPALG